MKKEKKIVFLTFYFLEKLLFFFKKERLQQQQQMVTKKLAFGPRKKVSKNKQLLYFVQKFTDCGFTKNCLDFFFIHKHVVNGCQPELEETMDCLHIQQIHLGFFFFLFCENTLVYYYTYASSCHHSVVVVYSYHTCMWLLPLH